MKNKYILVDSNSNGIYNNNNKTWISLDNISQFLLNEEGYIESIYSGGYLYYCLYDIDNKYIGEIKDLEVTTPLELFMKIRLYGNLILEFDDI